VKAELELGATRMHFSAVSGFIVPQLGQAICLGWAVYEVPHDLTHFPACSRFQIGATFGEQMLPGRIRVPQQAQ